MLRRYPKLKWTLIVFASLIILLVGFGWWFMNLLPEPDENYDITTSQVVDIPYLSQNIQPNRGKILAVVTSTDVMGTSGKRTGYELTELARAYYVFQANGFTVDIASPLGGNAPVVLDDDDMGIFDYAFLNDPTAQNKTEHTIPLKEVVAKNYEAIFFVGGKGAMFDFPDNKHIQSIVKELYQADKVVGAVCHGPAALVNVMQDNGRPLLEDKVVSGFTNDEELLLISDAETIFPFLLQDKLQAQGAHFNEGAMYLEKISHDDNLVTGQNPWSVWKLAETMIVQLGYTPKYREITAEENAVAVLEAYESYGSQKARDLIDQMTDIEKKPIARQLIAIHSVMAVMKGEPSKFMGLVRLTSYAKRKSRNL